MHVSGSLTFMTVCHPAVLGYFHFLQNFKTCHEVDSCTGPMGPTPSVEASRAPTGAAGVQVMHTDRHGGPSPCHTCTFCPFPCGPRWKTSELLSGTHVSSVAHPTQGLAERPLQTSFPTSSPIRDIVRPCTGGDTLLMRLVRVLLGTRRNAGSFSLGQDCSSRRSESFTHSYLNMVSFLSYLPVSY